MITKWIRFTVSADDAGAFHSALRRVEDASKPEKGCVHYAAFVDREESCQFCVLEIWDSEAALETHRSSEHLVTFKNACGGMIKEKVALDLDPLVEA